MTASAANQTLINAGFNINIEGTTNYNEGSDAKVVSQFPLGGTVGTKGDIISVTFRYLDVTD
jgi:beta-lactam-binding protein with PASTA domain